ncbi:hypothetical protein LINPERHAP1_LOCUS30346 [Linum perenne]
MTEVRKSPDSRLIQRSRLTLQNRTPTGKSERIRRSPIPPHRLPLFPLPSTTPSPTPPFLMT